jgi:hypothetical protein
MVPAWAFPLLGVVGMLAFAAFAVRVRRGRTSTRQIYMVQPDEEACLSDGSDDYSAVE